METHTRQFAQGDRLRSAPKPFFKNAAGVGCTHDAAVESVVVTEQNSAAIFLSQETLEAAQDIPNFSKWDDLMIPTGSVCHCPGCEVTN